MPKKNNCTTQDLTAMLKEGIQTLYTSDSYKAYLSAMSRFHNYSFRNSMLIYQQKPDATLVAGYRIWQDRFERHVNKGEKGIRILFPMITKQNDTEDPAKPSIIFRAGCVFDISQTSGKELPGPFVKHLDGEVRDYAGFLKVLKLISPVPVQFEHIPTGACGYFHVQNQVIVIDESLSQVQTIKTLIHELSHALLHDGNTACDTRTREVQAESIAYTVCKRFGIDTSDYSFAYIAGWSSDQSLEELSSSMEVIQKTADQLILDIMRLRSPEVLMYLHIPEKTPDNALPF